MRCASTRYVQDDRCFIMEDREKCQYAVILSKARTHVVWGSEVERSTGE